MSASWKQRPEGGGRFALWLIRGVGRHGGRTLGRALLYPITLYFLLRRGPERRDSRAWLRRALGRHASLLDVARHIHTFAATILDRVFLLSESTRRFDVEVRGLDGLHRLLGEGRGVLLFGSHLGSFEVLRVLARQAPDYTLRVVLDKAHNPAMTQLLDALNPEIAATVIDAGQDGPSLMLEIQQAVQSGAMVALLVDRAQPGGATVAADFLGRPARFPLAPWLIASVLKAPVVLGFGLYRGGNRYELVFEPFRERIEIPRGQRRSAAAAVIRDYAARLEHHARSAPYNWFNFYDFWQDDDGNEQAETPAPGRSGVDGGAGAGHDGRGRRAAAG